MKHTPFLSFYRTALLTLMSALLLANVATAQVETLDSVVAIVDDDVVLSSELRERLAMITQNLEARGIEMPEQETLVRETLDRLILESIQLQLADRYGIRIPDAQLDEAMQRMASQNGLTLQQFRGEVERKVRALLTCASKCAKRSRCNACSRVTSTEASKSLNRKLITL